MEMSSDTVPCAKLSGKAVEYKLLLSEAASKNYLVDVHTLARAPRFGRIIAIGEYAVQ